MINHKIYSPIQDHQRIDIGYNRVLVPFVLHIFHRIPLVHTNDSNICCIVDFFCIPIVVYLLLPGYTYILLGIIPRLKFK